MFQFTLGIPGFDDALVPRIVGIAVILLLVANHVAGSNPAPAQVSDLHRCLSTLHVTMGFMAVHLPIKRR